MSNAKTSRPKTARVRQQTIYMCAPKTIRVHSFRPTSYLVRGRSSCAAPLRRMHSRHRRQAASSQGQWWLICRNRTWEVHKRTFVKSSCQNEECGANGVLAGRGPAKPSRTSPSLSASPQAWHSHTTYTANTCATFGSVWLMERRVQPQHADSSQGTSSRRLLVRDAPAPGEHAQVAIRFSLPHQRDGHHPAN